MRRSLAHSLARRDQTEIKPSLTKFDQQAALKYDLKNDFYEINEYFLSLSSSLE
jgi:hypothetical protein